MTDEPAVSAWHEAMGLSTSAILRRTQDELAETKAALAASQADLTRAKDELNEMVARKARMQRDLEGHLAEARERLAEMTVAARKADEARAELDRLRGDV